MMSDILVNIGTGNGLLTLMNNTQWNLIQNTNILIQENVFENGDCFVQASMCWI